MERSPVALRWMVGYQAGKSNHMNTFTNRALAGALALTLTCVFSSAALAHPGNGHGQSTVQHGNSGRHGNSGEHGNSRQHTDSDQHADASRHGNSAIAHSCLNPAGHMRGWCQTHTGGDFVTGRVTGVNGNMATVLLSNGQTIDANTQYLVNRGQVLTVGQQVTLRGLWQNGAFDVNNGVYNNYSGSYSVASIKGMVLSVSGTTIQIAQGFSLVKINDANAAVNGVLYPGRTITASGNWSGTTFVANTIR